MHERRIPEWLRHAPAPSVRGFAMLAAFEAVARGILISVFPLLMFRTLQDAQMVSLIYFIIGITSLIAGLLVPIVTRYLPRRWVYIVGVLMFAIGSLLAILGTATAIVIGLLLNTVAVVLTFVCFNAYVLDYISKIELGNCETSRMFYSALGWTVGPVLGVFLFNLGVVGGLCFYVNKVDASEFFLVPFFILISIILYNAGKPEFRNYFKK